MTSQAPVNLRLRIKPREQYALFWLVPAMYMLFMLIKSLYVAHHLAHLPWQAGGFAANAAFPLILAGGCLGFRPWIRAILLYVLGVLTSLAFLADTLYLRYYHDFVTMPVLVEIFQVKKIGDSVFALFRFSDMILGIDLLLLPLLYLPFFRARWMRYTPASGTVHSDRKLALQCIGIGLSIAIMQISIALLTNPSTFSREQPQPAVAAQLGVLGFHAAELVEYLRYDAGGQPIPVSDHKLEEMAEWFHRHAEQPGTPDKLFGIARNSNILAIQLESFQTWVVGRRMNGKEITPNLNRFLARSLYFPNYYRQTDQGRTADAEFLSLNSLYPVDSGAVYFRFQEHRYAGLPTILSQNGYFTSAMVAFDPTFWNRQRMYEAQGFKRFYTNADYVDEEHFGLGLTDDSFFRQSLPKLPQLPQPSFSFMITLSSHGPYKLPARYQELELGALQGSMVGNYMHSVHYTDAVLGAFLDALEHNGILDHTVVAMYGDHDSGILPDDPNYLAVLGIRKEDAAGWYRQMKTPLVIHLPGDREAGVYEQAKGQIDLAPTLLQLVGIRTDKLPMMGDSLVNGNDSLVVFRDHSFTDGHYFFITPDGTFEHGTAYELPSGTIVDKALVSESFHRAGERLSISDNLIESDAIVQLKERLERIN